MQNISRRFFVINAAAISLAGCTSSGSTIFGGSQILSGKLIAKPNYQVVYSSFRGEAHPVPAFDYNAVNPEFLRQEVEYLGSEAPGMVIVNPSTKHLYHVDQPGRATRYGVGVGKEGFGWSGNARVSMARVWPDWVPPKEMVERDPHIRAQLVSTSRGQGVPGGPKSPLGARALYLGAGGQDTGYRIHGTTEPETIGTSVSSGCIRMVNQDIIHLYQRVAEGAPVVVIA